MAAADDLTVAALLSAHAWRPIPNCPGRLALPLSDQSPQELLRSALPVRECHSAHARDAVLVTVLPDGGLISYRRADGRYLHTLNTIDGFRRKLEQLGISA